MNKNLTGLLIMIVTFFFVGAIFKIVVVAHPELLNIVKKIVANRLQTY
ncbi:hypothetical protein FI615_002212 [Enterococcus faecium]|nr:hypothetical protein [Enterococcus faecium]EMF0115793.1 hypothetical protein [Enterococcus hirae]